MLLRQGTRSLVIAATVVYAVFAVSCFRLAFRYEEDHALAIGEGLFTLVGALALAAAVVVPRRRAAIVLLGTLPLVGWFVATPWNSGPPFLLAGLVVPVAAVIALGVGAQRRRAS